jgi:Ca2+-binding EF-hand superfamily protein
MDLARVLQYLGCKPSRSEVKLIIWEVDDDLDGFVSEEEFTTMYKRCITDKTDLEPRKLFNLVQFLMYDKKYKGKVTVEETLQILFVRHGRTKLDDEIEAIFGQDEKNPDGSEKEITYSEYVEKINKRALEKQ